MKTLKLTYYSAAILGTLWLLLEGLGFQEPTVVFNVEWWKISFVCASLIMICDIFEDIIHVWYKE